MPSTPTSLSRPAYRRLPLKLAAALASMLITVFVLEAVFRIVGLQGDYHRPRRDVPMVSDGKSPTQQLPYGFVPHAKIRSTYDSDPRGYVGPSNSVDHLHNAEGWRDVEHALDKPAGTYRILGLGDSYLWG